MPNGPHFCYAVSFPPRFVLCFHDESLQSVDKKKERVCFKMDLRVIQVSINVGSLFSSSLKDSGRGRSFQWVEFQVVHLTFTLPARRNG